MRPPSRSLSVALLAVALAGCASRAEMRAVQTPPPAPTTAMLAPYEHPLRDAVALEWIGGVSQGSYLFAEPNQDVIRPVVKRALRETGLLAGTPVRARYGLRIEVTEAHGPAPGADFRASMAAIYTLVDRASGQVLFQTTVDSTGKAPFLGLNEQDLRESLDRSGKLLSVVNPTAAAFVLYNLGYEWDITPWAGGELRETDLYKNYSKWTDADWHHFWRLYTYSVVGSLAAGPLVQGVKYANPVNFLPIASEDAAAKARREGRDMPVADRSGPMRAAEANQRAVAANVAAFLLDLSASQHIPLMPILPCHGGPDIDAAKRALLEHGESFVTDDCAVRR